MATLIVLVCIGSVCMAHHMNMMIWMLMINKVWDIKTNYQQGMSKQQYKCINNYLDLGLFTKPFFPLTQIHIFHIFMIIYTRLNEIGVFKAVVSKNQVYTRTFC